MRLQLYHMFRKRGVREQVSFDGTLYVRTFAGIMAWLYHMNIKYKHCGFQIGSNI